MGNVKFQVIKYPTDSFPVINGDSTDQFYIVKNGQLLRSSTVFGDDKQEEITTGGFFGVIACMSARPAIENVQTLTASLLIPIKRHHFGDLLAMNAPIALKIIRYFSKELRYFNSVLTELTSQGAQEEHPKYLYDIAQYYSTKRMNFSYAANAYLKYLKFCPEGEFVSLAKTQLVKLMKKYKIKLQPQREGYLYIYEDDDIIFLENEPGMNLYIIQEGEVKISKILNNKEVLLNILKPGDIFGEMAILENKPRNATAIASGRIKLMAVSKKNFGAVVQQHPEIATRIIKLLSERIWFMHRHISNMFITDPETRLYDALYIQLLKDRVEIHNGGSYVFDFEVHDIINFTGLDYSPGEQALRNILDGKKFYLTKSKITCANITDIERKMNVIQRNAQIKQNLYNPHVTRD